MSDCGTSRLHVAFGVDEQYMHPMGVTIASIIANNPQLPMVFHVFTPQISAQSRTKLRLLTLQTGQPIHVHLMDDLEALNRLPLSKSALHVSKAAYIRLLIPQYLADQTDRVLYLDADILCVGTLDELRTWDLGVATAAVVRDRNAASTQAYLNQSSSVHDGYFNSGVLLINIPRWCAERVSERALACMADPRLNLQYVDQDALNIVLDGSVQWLETAWNHQYPLTRALRKKALQLNYPTGTRFLHFIGPLKPWRAWNPHAAKALFLSYQQASPWADTVLDADFSPRERHVYLRFRYQESFRNKHWLQGLGWYLRFVCHKRLFGAG